MSTITSPILLDETGRNINESILAVVEAIKTNNSSIIDDNDVSDVKVWSSEKIANDFTVAQTISGKEITIKNCVSGTPILIETPVAQATTLVITHNGYEYSTTVPAAGNYNWNTGFFTYEDGTFVKLAAHNIVAMPNDNVLSINEGTIKAIYRTIAAGLSAYDLINGGSAEGV